MTVKYHLRKLAQSDLESSCEQWGADQADSYLDTLIQRFDWLAENLILDKPRDDIKLGYFCFPERMHLIFYTVKNKQVEIIGIPHKSVDITRHF